jgi:hypothetical protein
MHGVFHGPRRWKRGFGAIVAPDARSSLNACKLYPVEVTGFSQVWPSGSDTARSRWKNERGLISQSAGAEGNRSNTGLSQLATVIPVNRPAAGDRGSIGFLCGAAADAATS